MKSLLFFFSLLLAASLSAAVASASVVVASADSAAINFAVSLAAARQSVVYDDEWYPIEDVSNLHVQEIANFAVDEHNKNLNSHLKLHNVNSGELQIAKVGIIYHLILVIGWPQGVPAKYDVWVLEKTWQVYELTSFKKI